MFENRLNATSLAEKIGCGTATVYRYLNAVKMPSLEMVVRIADYFNVSVDFLLGLESENYTKSFLKRPTFSESFCRLLKECSVSQYYIEKKTGISHSVAGYWKSGKTTPSVESVVKLAKALNRTVDFVIGREI